MSNTFSNVAMATDLHFGGKGNSKIFNEDITDFLHWFIAESKKRSCETCVILGDWHDSRSTINVLTLNYSVNALHLLSQNFKTVYILTGNHDLFYREKREIHSLPMGKDINNIMIVDEILDLGDTLFIPWLVEEEWKQVVKSKAKYIFGHLELPGFKMNAMVEMPDHGGVNGTHFKNQDYVFTGHFHKRQYKDNIHYIGNPFGHNYGDSGDIERGACFLEYGGRPEYVNYVDGPQYFSIGLSELLENPTKYATEKSYLKISVDIQISYEESLALREEFSENFKVREFKLLPQRIETEYNEVIDVAEHATVDTIVIEAITNIDSEAFSTNTLMEIYSSL